MAVLREYSGINDNLTDLCMVKVNEGCSVVKCKVLWSHGKLNIDWGRNLLG